MRYAALMRGPILLLIPVLAAVAAPGLAEERGHRCRFEGWADDANMAGVEVRAGPSATARLVGRLPPPVTDGEYAFGVGFRVVEARNGWFRIQAPRPWSEDETPPPANLPTGWIEGRSLDFALQTDKAFAAPNPRAAVVATSWQASDGAHTFDYRLPSDCRGEWVRLLVTGHDRREQVAWARGVCGIQTTTCDGMQGDSIPPDDLPALD